MPPTRPIHCVCDTQDEETVEKEEDTMSHCDSDQYDWLVSAVHVLQTNARALIGEEKAVGGGHYLKRNTV